MNFEQTEANLTNAIPNEHLAPEFSENTIVSPMVIKIHFPEGLSEDNFAEHEIYCSIVFDKDFSNLFHPKISEQAMQALLLAITAELYHISEGHVSTAEFIGQYLQGLIEVIDKMSHTNVKFE